MVSFITWGGQWGKEIHLEICTHWNVSQFFLVTSLDTSQSHFGQYEWLKCWPAMEHSKQMIKCFTYSPLFHLTSTWHYSHGGWVKALTVLHYSSICCCEHKLKTTTTKKPVRSGSEEWVRNTEAISSLLKMCMAQSPCGYGGISSPDSVFISLWWYLSQVRNIWGWWFLLASFPGPHQAPHQLSRRGPGRFSYVSDGTDRGNYLIM